MVEIGAAGLGLVIGWLLPVTRAGGDRAVAASAAIVALTAGVVGIDQGVALGEIVLASVLAAAYVHAAWIAELRRRYGARLPG